MASSDSEDEDLKAAIALSLAETVKHEDIDSPIKVESPVSASDPSSASTKAPLSTAAGLAGLDRKSMEAERLARLAHKRQRSISPPARNPRKAPKLETKTIALPSGARLTTFSTTIDRDQQQRKSPAGNAANHRLKQSPKLSDVKVEPEGDSGGAQQSMPQGSVRYPHGVVKNTWAFGIPRDSRDIKLEEVLEPLTLRTAVLSSFQWDAEWIAAKLKTPLVGGSTRCVYVMQAKEESLRKTMLRDTEEYRAFLELCFPPMYGQIFCMHSKLMLLFHPNKLRIAIPTANLLSFDWGETGTMENSVFIIDLPRRADGASTNVDALPSFRQEMLFFLEKQGLEQRVRDGVLKFDFSATEAMRFIHTVGGTSYGEDAGRTGLPGLARAVRELKLQSDENLEIDFAASSIGSLNNDYLERLHAAARGEDMFDRPQGQNIPAKSDFFKHSSKQTPLKKSGIRDKVRIYFPTRETVTSSIAGAAGSICLSRARYEAAKFPRSCFRDYRSCRTGLVSHNKLLYARGKQSRGDGTASRNIAWVYVGSANMSKSAWGDVFYDKKLKAWKVNCRNWECGVLLPVADDRLNGLDETDVSVKKEEVEGEDPETESEDDMSRPVNGHITLKNERTEQDDSETQSEDGEEHTHSSKPTSDLVGMDVFDGIAKPPFEFPASPHGNREPWYSDEYGK